jgi:integral membrane protein
MKLFSESEAWILFKFTAIGEGFGWSLLLYGIAAQHFHLPGEVFMLPVGGSIHGILFLGYLGVVIAGFPSLGWSLKKAAFGVFLSIVPFATLVFESREAHARELRGRTSLRRVKVCAIITSDDNVLAIQPSSSVVWHLPGGYVTEGEVPNVAMERVLTKLTGLKAEIGPLAYVAHTKTHEEDELVFYFLIKRLPAFDLDRIRTTIRLHMAVDEVKYISPNKTSEFEPDFLRNIPVSRMLEDNRPVEFF